MATILRAINKETIINKNCAIIGQGPIGLIFTCLLRHMGAKKVIAVDPLDYRLLVAKNMGATHVTTSQEQELKKWIIEITEGEMLDLCVEAVGTPEALFIAACLVKHGGELLIFGVPTQQAQQFPVQHVFRNEIKIRSSVGPQCVYFFKSAVEMISNGSLDLTPIVGPVLSWDQAEIAFEKYESRAKDCLKAILKF